VCIVARLLARRGHRGRHDRLDLRTVVDEQVDGRRLRRAASSTITLHSLPAVGPMLEISAVAVVGDKEPRQGPAAGAVVNSRK
jgi:hypothetical protein